MGFPVSYYDRFGIPRTFVMSWSYARPYPRFHFYRPGIFFPQYFMSKERCRTDSIQLCQNCRVSGGHPGRCAPACSVAVGCANHYGISGSMIDDLRYRYPWGVGVFGSTPWP